MDTKFCNKRCLNVKSLKENCKVNFMVNIIRQMANNGIAHKCRVHVRHCCPH